MSEMKENRFRRIAGARVNKIINMLKLLGNCSHTGNYSYTKQQVEEIFGRLRSEVDKAYKRYQMCMKKSLSRTVQLLCGSKSDFLFVADSGPGDTTEKGLIVPKFGSKPENHVAVSMTFEALSGLLLMTKAHYEAWLVSYYLQRKPIEKNNGSKNATPAKECAEDPHFNKFMPGEMF